MTENLIALERGADELLLADSFYLRPLYVRRGRERVKRLLAAASPGRSPGELLTVFPEDAALIRLLLEHGILSDAPLNRDGCQRPGPAAAPVHPRDRMTLYLLVGESCNLTCIYCLNGPQTYRRDNRAGMTPAVAGRSVAMCLAEREP